MEAVKQGSATIGIKSSTHVVLVALKVCGLNEIQCQWQTLCECPGTTPTVGKGLVDQVAPCMSLK
jgi:hypothetical protein